MDDRVLRQGVRRLRAWLPAVRAEVERGNVSELHEPSTVFEGQAPHIVEDNFLALVIYQAPLGGWHADMLFKEVPPGVPSAIGSPVQQPLQSLADAESHARALLRLCLTQSKRNRERRTPPGLDDGPGFTLYGWGFKLSRLLYDIALAEAPQFSDGYGSEESAIARIEAVLAELCPEGFDGEAFKLWSRERQAMLMGVLHVAALSKVIRYPPMVDQAPGAEER